MRIVRTMYDTYKYFSINIFTSLALLLMSGFSFSNYNVLSFFRRKFIGSMANTKAVFCFSAFFEANSLVAWQILKLFFVYIMTCMKNIVMSTAV